MRHLIVAQHPGPHPPHQSKTDIKFAPGSARVARKPGGESKGGLVGEKGDVTEEATLGVFRLG